MKPEGRAEPLAPGFDGLFARLPDWSGLSDLLLHNLHGHGDSAKWLRALARISHLLPSADADALAMATKAGDGSGLESRPAVRPSSISFGDTVTVAGELPRAEGKRLREALLALHPWRKGPFSLYGIHVDSEWRSDRKWRRVAPHVDLEGLRVLDVGCGNGYYGWRMLGAGAALVVGIDPSVLCCVQHQAIQSCVGDDRNQVLPLALEALPEALSCRRFDAVFSMGVVYHRRDPLDHLRRLRRCLVAGGIAIIESLVVESAETLNPGGRYARMRNVWQVPTPEGLVRWTAEAGFADVRLADLNRTTTAEQRSTEWMHFDSLTEALDPSDSTRTIEGHPAPKRCVLIARNP